MSRPPLVLAALLIAKAAAATAEKPFDEGVRLAGEGKWPEARAKFEAVVQAEPRNATAWKALGVTLGKLEEMAAAEEALNQSCKLDPKLPDACYYWARSLYTLNRFESALAALKQTLDSDPRKGRAYTAIAQAHEALGQAKEAETAFRKAQDLQDAPLEARLHYGVFLFRSGRLADAAVPLEEALRMRPSYGPAAAELGRVYYQQGRIDAAIAMLERALASGGAAENTQLLLERAKRLRQNQGSGSTVR